MLPMPRKSHRNYAVFAALIGCLIAVHFVLVFNTGATTSVSQAAVFSWAAIAIIGALGLASTFFLNLTQLRGAGHRPLPLKRRIGWPACVGIAIGIAVVAADLLTGWSRTVAAEMHLPSIHIAFPLSIPIYFGGAILVTVIYYYILIPFIDWLIAHKLLKGRHEPTVFWAAGILLALIEPITQGDFSAIARHGFPAVVNLIGDLALNLAQVSFLRRSGLVAAATVRIAFYSVWHVIYGLF